MRASPLPASWASPWQFTYAVVIIAATGMRKAATIRSPNDSSTNLLWIGFFLEYDDERSGNFEPLRFVPAEKIIVLGLISTKRPELERREDVLRRINEAAKVIPLEQLALSPQCGFASTMEGNLLTEADQWAKLQLCRRNGQGSPGVESWNWYAITAPHLVTTSKQRHVPPEPRCRRGPPPQPGCRSLLVLAWRLRGQSSLTPYVLAADRHNLRSLR